MRAGDGSAVSILQWWPSLVPCEIHQEQAVSSPIDSSKPQTHPTKNKDAFGPTRWDSGQPSAGAMPSFYIGRCFGSSTPASSCQESLPYAPSPPKSSSPVQGSCRHGGFATQYLNPQKASDVHLVPAQQLLQSHRNSHNAMKRKFEAETGNYCSAKTTQFGESREPARSLSPLSFLH